MNLPQTGACQCGALRYEITEAPQLVYTCHCTECQRLTGSAFTMAMVIGAAAFRLAAPPRQPRRLLRTDRDSTTRTSSEDPWGGGLPTLHGGASARNRPDTETDAALFGHTGFAIDHRPLQFGGAPDGVDDAREFHQHPVAGRLDDAAGMLADFRVDELAAMRLEAFVRPFLVRYVRENTLAFTIP